MPCVSDSFLVVSDFNGDLIKHYCVLSRRQNYLQPCMCTVQISFSRRAILSQQKDLYLADTHPRPPLKYWCYIKFPYSLMKELWKLDTDEQDINFKPLAPSPYLSHTHIHSGRGETIGHTSLHISLCCD